MAAVRTVKGMVFAAVFHDSFCALYHLFIDFLPTFNPEHVSGYLFRLPSKTLRTVCATLGYYVYCLAIC